MNHINNVIFVASRDYGPGLVQGWGTRTDLHPSSASKSVVATVVRSFAANGQWFKPYALGDHDRFKESEPQTQGNVSGVDHGEISPSPSLIKLAGDALQLDQTSVSPPLFSPQIVLPRLWYHFYCTALHFQCCCQAYNRHLVRTPLVPAIPGSNPL